MANRRFLAGCLALAVAMSLSPALAQKAVPVAPAIPATPLPTSPAPAVTPAPLPVAPTVAVPPPTTSPRYEASRSTSFEDDIVEGDLARPEAPAAAPPPDVPAYSDLCKASPKPPWCSDAPRGNGN